jgi:hypothetical protein
VFGGDRRFPQEKLIFLGNHAELCWELLTGRRSDFNDL